MSRQMSSQCCHSNHILSLSISFMLSVYRPFALLALRRLIPDFDERFIDAGGRIKPWKLNSYWSGIKLGMPKAGYLGGRGLPKHHNLSTEDLPDTIWCTRANLEVFLRKEILEAYPGIEVATGTVTSLLQGPSGTIKGVVYSPKGQRTTKTANASLVVGKLFPVTGDSKEWY